MARHDRPYGKDLEVALRHPLRRQILEAIEIQDGIAMGELAERLGRPLANVRYHLGVLRAAGESRDRQAT
jgi:DNA-binding transcriptional ArsR family regulator